MKKTELAKAIRKILSTSDLETMSRKMVRKQLETMFSVSMEEYKNFINEEITKVIEEQEEDDSGDDEEEVDDEPPAKKAKKAAAPKAAKAAPKKKAVRKKNEDGSASGGFAQEMLLSPELSEVLGITQSSRPQLVKKMWEYIREQGLQDPNDKRTIILNDALKNVFQRDSFTMFSMNKYLKRHVLKPEDLPAGGWADIQRDGESSEEDEEKTAEKERKKAAKIARKTQAKESGEKPKRAPPAPNSGINAPLTLSEELSDLLGESQMSRPQVIKKLWVYIKENGLQNPENKQEINCDETLTHLFGEPLVTMFSMNKLLKPHLLGKAKLED
ncbi:Aste57867_24824 [Aphanomyces stellatus]|uniref:Aste57867_24824 protein n=1 Tax=Aphanomyces stellatus TaxID=120398 RepID=A0A485LS39_9STRA|nr:hypothetical protein As57867_024746 [Aphanomyces stellatus]VFU01459.1 Aste57867_24824 [Aphanomyces stellatus]